MAPAGFLCILFIAPALAVESSTCVGNCSANDGDGSALLQHSQITLHNDLIEVLPPFSEFIQEHGRTYEEGSEEYEMRSKLYTQFVRKVQGHNSNPDRRWTA